MVILGWLLGLGGMSRLVGWWDLGLGRLVGWLVVLRVGGDG